MQTHEIYGHLLIKGHTSKTVGEIAEAEASTVRRVISNQIRSGEKCAKVRATISKIIKKEISELWPEDAPKSNEASKAA